MLFTVLLEVLAKSLLVSVNDAVETRVMALNASTGAVISAVWLERNPASVGEPSNVESHGLQPGSIPDPNLPWFENAGTTTELRFDSSVVQFTELHLDAFHACYFTIFCMPFHKDNTFHFFTNLDYIEQILEHFLNHTKKLYEGKNKFFSFFINYKLLDGIVRIKRLFHF